MTAWVLVPRGSRYLSLGKQTEPRTSGENLRSREMHLVEKEADPPSERRDLCGRRERFPRRPHPTVGISADARACPGGDPESGWGCGEFKSRCGQGLHAS